MTYHAVFIFGLILSEMGRPMTAHLIPPQFRMTRFSASILRPPYCHLPSLPLPTSLKLAFYRPNFNFTQPSITLRSYFTPPLFPQSCSHSLGNSPHFSFSSFQPSLRILCCKSFSCQVFAYHSLCNHVPLSRKHLKIGSEMFIFQKL